MFYWKQVPKSLFPPTFNVLSIHYQLWDLLRTQQKSVLILHQRLENLGVSIVTKN